MKHQPKVLYTTAGSVCILTLNRPQALNALTISMVQMIARRFEEWEQDTDCHAIIFKSSQAKAFCTGGDIRGIANDLRVNYQRVIDLFDEEYRLAHMIATMKTPIVTFVDGIAMGAGLGIAVHAPIRIATETTMVAMPETAIGGSPDVGTTFFLPRLAGEIGTYLGLTGHRLKGADVVHAGLATHFVPSDRLAELEKHLLALSEPDLAELRRVVDEFAVRADYSRFSLLPHRAAIDRQVLYNTMEEIIIALGRERSRWAQDILHTLDKMSPLGLRATLHQLRFGRNHGIADCVRKEFDMSQKLAAAPDFIEGIIALVVDRRPPVWSPPSLADLSEDTMHKQFYTPQAPLQITLLNAVNFVAYPHQKGQVSGVEGNLRGHM
ncbi:ClpP/crotonase-like domain-containing protein [Thamnocephalis sphaerospora]|uniref:3-hydroxyisobutyryl-CoA hydrolase n=1 Tax=Thamnocephalis sphaerospora TaxID=78915 RepID=A0A4P9XS68_9FUNG|nr:ClpP/crotonase-like domain-containing protein [Thamnocephalis sphaerospora]|eukprot:RKP08963.1 ClpP/crotonase-like domain-containing protein [Thamnocephalis sphaerospora]